ncbi:MAG: ABC-F family ATP-binding cassette domain-containing protein [Clostridia bacterium]
MSILNVENVSHGFGARKILDKATFRLLKGEHVGLVGANGEGKSTFLDIITGKKIPDEGKIEWCNRITTGYLDQLTTLTKGKTIREALKEAFQHMVDLESEMLDAYDKMSDATEDEINFLLRDVGEIQNELDHSGYYTLDSKIEEVANGLGLGEIGLDKDVSQLSGGQRSKVLLTKLLLENPMILILDEPTNFLDENHIGWLKNFLKNYENSFILVSHDVPFLSDVVNVIYHIDTGVLNRYPGSYQQYLTLSKVKSEQNQKAYDRQQKEIDRLETFVAKNKARASTATLARSRQKQLDKMDVIELGRERIKPIFNFKTSRSPGRLIFQAKDLVIGYAFPLTRPLNFVLERNEKIAIKGVNGLGKTTLLKTLLGLLKPLSGKVEQDYYLFPGYFEQESNRTEKSALNEVWDEYPNMTNGEVRSALAKCGLTTDHINSKMMVLSGGESAKVRLCKILLKEVNLLVLDEPTNHLDIDAKAELKRALIEFKGTVILVSHEPEFYEDIVSAVWNVEDWTSL